MPAPFPGFLLYPLPPCSSPAPLTARVCFSGPSLGWPPAVGAFAGPSLMALVRALPAAAHRLIALFMLCLLVRPSTGLSAPPGRRYCFVHLWVPRTRSSKYLSPSSVLDRINENRPRVIDLHAVVCSARMGRVPSRLAHPRRSVCVCATISRNVGFAVIPQKELYHLPDVYVTEKLTQTVKTELV